MINREKYHVEEPITPYHPSWLSSLELEDIEKYKQQVIKYKEDCIIYDQKKKEYDLKKKEMDLKYKTDLLKSLGIEDEVKAEEIWNLADEIANGTNYKESSAITYFDGSPMLTYEEVFDYYIEKLAKLARKE
jgi:hypothetical protein